MLKTDKTQTDNKFLTDNKWKKLIKKKTDKIRFFPTKTDKRRFLENSLS